MVDIDYLKMLHDGIIPPNLDNKIQEWEYQYKYKDIKIVGQVAKGPINLFNVEYLNGLGIKYINYHQDGEGCLTEGYYI